VDAVDAGPILRVLDDPFLDPVASTLRIRWKWDERNVKPQMRTG
jgi:hypothetical protein